MNETFLTIEKILSLNISWIKSADSKIPAFIAINTAMLGVIASILPKATEWSILLAIITCFTSILLLGSLVCLIISSFPRLDGPKGSYIYFGGITEIDKEKYITTLIAGVTPDLLKDIATQCYRNAEIAKIKFNYIRWATILIYVTIPFFLLTISLLYGAKQ